MTLAIGVLLSGTGTNLQAILDAIAEKRLDAHVKVVVSNVASAQGLGRARAAGVPTEIVDHRAYTSRKHFDAKVVRALERHGVEWVVLAGFMRVLTSTLLDAFPMRVVNIHPALLPSFPGLNAQSQALKYGVRVAGCTVHFVDGTADTGPIIAQAVVPVLHADDDESLRARILDQEHALLVSVLQWIAQGRVTVTPNTRGGRPHVVVDGVAPYRGLAD